MRLLAAELRKLEFTGDTVASAGGTFSFGDGREISFQSLLILRRNFSDIDAVSDLRIPSSYYAFGNEFLVAEPEHHFNLGAYLKREHGFDVAAASADLAS